MKGATDIWVTLYPKKILSIFCIYFLQKFSYEYILSIKNYIIDTFLRSTHVYYISIDTLS